MGLKDKASRIDFGSLPGAAVPPPVTLPLVADGKRPKTAPGAMMAFAVDQRSELVQENEALRQRAAKADEVQGRLDEVLGELQQWQGAKATRAIDCARIVRSRFANRHAQNFVGDEFEQLKAEIRDAGGNVQPIKVRALASADGEPLYELVFGHRRHEACRQLGLPVVAVVDNLDDKALFVEMDRENRSRKDLSAWEQGQMYRRALSEGLFPSNRKLAEATGVDLGAVGKALSLADLPDAVVAAFASPLELQFRWAKPLNDALAADEQGVLSRAQALKTEGRRLPAKQVFERLIGVDGQGVERFNPPASSEVVVEGESVATVLAKAGGLTITFKPGAVGADQVPELTALLQGFVARSRQKLR